MVVYKAKGGSKMKHLVITLTGLTLIATLATVGLHLANQPAWAAGVGVFTFFLWLSLLVTATAVVVSWWSASLMERGAVLALRSQESDDRRDVALIKSISNMTRALLRLNRPELPALPLSSQSSWLPELSEIEGEFEEVQ